jgi:hypothetical protein
MGWGPEVRTTDDLLLRLGGLGKEWITCSIIRICIGFLVSRLLVLNAVHHTAHIHPAHPQHMCITTFALLPIPAVCTVQTVMNSAPKKAFSSPVHRTLYTGIAYTSKVHPFAQSISSRERAYKPRNLSQSSGFFVSSARTSSNPPHTLIDECDY